LERETSERLRTQIELLTEQKQQFDECINALRKHCEQLQQELLEKTHLINSHFSKRK